jgi:hypothetical protein
MHELPPIHQPECAEQAIEQPQETAAPDLLENRAPASLSVMQRAGSIRTADGSVVYLVPGHSGKISANALRDSIARRRANNNRNE